MHKPCPFCGGHGLFIDGDEWKRCWVRCNSCGARGPMTMSKVGEAWERWDKAPGDLVNVEIFE